MPNNKPAKRTPSWTELVKIRPSLLNRVELNKTVSDNVNDFQAVTYQGDRFSNKRVLRVDAPITHAMRLTLNGGLYQAKEMFRGMDSFTHPIKRPVLHNHDTKVAIGRVQSVIYEPIVPDAYPINNAHLLDHDQTFNVIRDMMDRGILEDPDFPGLGTLVATMHITDKDAIERFLDERSMSFSTRQVSDNLLDPRTGRSIWEHMFEDEEEGEDEWEFPPFLVLGAMRYPEVSDVTIAADELAFVREMQLIAGGDSLALDLKPVNIEGMFKFEDSDDTTIVLNSRTKPQSVPQDGDRTMKFDFKTINDNSSAEEIYKAYVELFTEQGKQDSALSTEELSGLKGSAFCFAGRSIPAHDKAHLDAAYELLDRAGFSDSTASHVKSILDSKAKKLGVNPSHRLGLKVSDFAENVSEFSDYDVAILMDALAREYSDRGMDHSALAQVTGFASKEVELNDQVSTFKAKVSSLETEKEALVSELDNMKVRVCDRGKLSLSVLLSLKDNLHIDSLETGIEKVNELSDEEVESKLSELSKDSELLDRLNLFIKGHATPIEERGEVVEDPTVQDNNADDVPGSAFNTVKQEYLDFHARNAHEANVWLADLKDFGYLSADDFTKLLSLTSKED